MGGCGGSEVAEEGWVRGIVEAYFYVKEACGRAQAGVVSRADLVHQPCGSAFS